MIALPSLTENKGFSCEPSRVKGCLMSETTENTLLDAGTDGDSSANILASADQILSTPKFAAQGTLMFKRADVIARLKRWRQRYVDGMRDAEDEGNDVWRDYQLHKLRAMNSLLEDIIKKCPVFENPQRAELADKSYEVRYEHNDR